MVEWSQPVRCLHCGRPASRPRTLCWPCYYNPRIRALYPTASKYPIRTNIMPCLNPTDFLPGSEGKIEVMARRAANRQDLHHPLDPKHDPVAEPIQLHTRRLILSNVFGHILKGPPEGSEYE